MQCLHRTEHRDSEVVFEPSAEGIICNLRCNAHTYTHLCGARTRRQLHTKALLPTPATQKLQAILVTLFVRAHMNAHMHKSTQKHTRTFAHTQTHAQTLYLAHTHTHTRAILSSRPPRQTIPDPPSPSLSLHLPPSPSDLPSHPDSPECKQALLATTTSPARMECPPPPLISRVGSTTNRLQNREACIISTHPRQHRMPVSCDDGVYSSDRVRRTAAPCSDSRRERLWSSLWEM